LESPYQGKEWLGESFTITTMKLIFEKIYPYVLGVVASVLWFRLNLTFPTNDSILSSTLTVSGIFVGFLATSKAILMTMTSTIIDSLKRSGYISELVSYIGQAIWINLVFCSFNVVGFFVNTSDCWYSILWMGIAIGSLTSFVRVTDIMLKIFKFS
jgi:hypothetical protein